MKVRIVELATGYWQAHFVGEEAEAFIDRSPDQALAGLIRANIRRLGIEEIVYASESPLADPSTRASQGDAILPLGSSHVPDRKKGS